MHFLRWARSILVSSICSAVAEQNKLRFLTCVYREILNKIYLVLPVLGSCISLCFTLLSFFLCVWQIHACADSNLKEKLYEWEDKVNDPSLVVNLLHLMVFEAMSRVLNSLAPRYFLPFYHLSAFHSLFGRVSHTFFPAFHAPLFNVEAEKGMGRTLCTETSSGSHLGWMERDWCRLRMELQGKMDDTWE